jgi:hypothetical protein
METTVEQKPMTSPPSAKELRSLAAGLRREYEALAGVKGKEGRRSQIWRKLCDLEVAAVVQLERGWW